MFFQTGIPKGLLFYSIQAIFTSWYVGSYRMGRGRSLFHMRVIRQREKITRTFRITGFDTPRFLNCFEKFLIVPGGKVKSCVIRYYFVSGFVLKTIRQKLIFGFISYTSCSIAAYASFGRLYKMAAAVAMLYRLQVTLGTGHFYPILCVLILRKCNTDREYTFFSNSNIHGSFNVW